MAKTSREVLHSNKTSIVAGDALSHRVTRVHCAEHPGRDWCEVHPQHGWGVAYRTNLPKLDPRRF